MILEENQPILEETNVNIWHEAGYTGDGVTIVLMDDGGVPREHMKDYYTNVLGDQGETGHSTNVGFAAHQTAPDAKIIALDAKRGFDEKVDWLVQHKNEIDLINVSLAGYVGMPTPKYKKLEELDIPIIVASGNDSYEDGISYPARYDFTIAIGAWSWKHDYVAHYSNGGPNLDAVAPSSIYMLRDDGHTWSVTGTSFAAPWATGMLACYIQWRNEHGLSKLKPEEARQFIHENTIDVEDKGFDYASGHGLFILPENIPETPKKEVEEMIDAKVVYQKEVVTTKVENKSVDAVIIDGTTYVPVREFANLLGLKLGFDNDTKTVTLSDK